MGPAEDSTRLIEHREAEGRAKPRHARTRYCLLKGCERGFYPKQSRQRYCNRECAQAARRWSRWKAQQSYRATEAGKKKRNEQGRRYRERVKSRRQTAAEEAAVVSARVITKDFFRLQL